MQGKAKLLGHAIHPMLIVFPLGLLTMVPIFDIVRFGTHDTMFGYVSFWMLVVGLVGGIAAAVPGFIDWLSIPRSTRAHRVGINHLAVNLVAVGLYVVSLILRLTKGIDVAAPVAFVLALVGMLVMLVGGWLGGELVQQHGLSVRTEAHLDAPSSLDADRLVRRPPQPMPREPSPTEPQPA